MKTAKEIEKESIKEGETPEEESGEYSEIDNFLKTLDKDEISYLKECLGKMDSEKSKDAKGEAFFEDKDFED